MRKVTEEYDERGRLVRRTTEEGEGLSLEEVRRAVLVHYPVPCVPPQSMLPEITWQGVGTYIAAGVGTYIATGVFCGAI